MSVIHRLDVFVIDRLVQPFMDALQRRNIATAENLGRVILNAAILASLFTGTCVMLQESTFSCDGSLVVSTNSLIKGFGAWMTGLTIWMTFKQVPMISGSDNITPKRVALFFPRVLWVGTLVAMTLFGRWNATGRTMVLCCFVYAILTVVGFYVSSCSDHPDATGRRNPVGTN